MKYSPEDIERIVTQRLRWRRRRNYSTPWSDAQHVELVGVMGEVAFAEEFDMPIDESEKPNGDGGIDFVTALGTVDVKTRRSTIANLRVRADKPIADYLFLAQYDDVTRRAKLVGWMTRDEVMGCRVERSNVPPKYHANYVVPRRAMQSVGKWKWMLKTKEEEVAA